MKQRAYLLIRALRGPVEAESLAGARSLRREVGRARAVLLLSMALALALLGVGWLARVAPMEEHTPLVPSAAAAARAANVSDASPRGDVLQAPRENVADTAAPIP